MVRTTSSAGEHAEHAVIFAAGRLGVEMRADIDGQGVRIGAGAGGEHRAHLVDAHASCRHRRTMS